MARPIRTSKLFKTRLAPVFPVTPFAAVTLTLVVVFMVMTPLTRRQARVQLPTAGLAGPGPVYLTRVLSIEKSGACVLDGRRLASEQVASALAGVAGQAPQPVLMVRGDKELTYRQVKDVLDKARTAGVQDIRLEVAASLATPPASSPATP